MSVYETIRQNAVILSVAAAFSLTVIPPVAAQTQTPAVNPFTGLAGKDSLSLKLEDAILTALEWNQTVTIQRLAPQIAQTYRSQQRETFDPVLSLSGSQNQTKLQRFLGTSSKPVEMTWDRSNYGINITENLPTGTNITASSTLGGSKSSLYEKQFSGVVGVTVTQALLQGLGFGANLASLRKADIDVAMSNQELKSVGEQTVSNVEKSYWNLYLAGEEIAIQEQSLFLANRQLEETMERVKVGILSELELAAVHAEVATRREALINAQSRQAQARLQFMYLINPQNASASAYPVTSDRPSIPSDTLDAVDLHEQLGVKYRPDLLQARLNLQKGELDVVQTKNGLLPVLDLTLTFNRTTYADSFNEAVPDINSPFYDATAGLTFKMPVTIRGARAEYARAKYTARQRELAVDNLERMVRMDVRSAYIEVVRARQQIEATRVTRELQEKNLEAEQEKFRVGKSTNYLVLQAQRDFTGSRRDEASALIDYLGALVDLYQAEGTLLERRGIEAPPAK
jgi:outer membrane protein